MKYRCMMKKKYCVSVRNMVLKTVEKEGYPLYQGIEMDENFSFSEMMHQPVRVKYNTRDKVLAHVKCLKRKLKLKCEIHIIASKILFLHIRRWLCQVEMKIIDCEKWIYLQIFKD